MNDGSGWEIDQNIPKEQDVQDNCSSHKTQKKEVMEQQESCQIKRENSDYKNNQNRYEIIRKNRSSHRFRNENIKENREQDFKNKQEINTKGSFNKYTQSKGGHNRVESKDNKQRYQRAQIQNINCNTQKQQPLHNKANQNLVSTNLPKAWPSCGFNIFGRKLSINLRRVQHFNANILVIPYRNLNLDYQPSEYVLSSNVDYRLKLKAKGQSLEKGGSIYLQKASKLGNYKALLFLRIDQSDKEQNLQTGLTYFMKIVSNLQQEKILDTLVFPLSKDLCRPSRIIQIFVKCLDLFTTIKKVHITTHDPNLYQKCMEDYNRYIIKMLNENELFLD